MHLFCMYMIIRDEKRKGNKDILDKLKNKCKLIVGKQVDNPLRL